MNARTAFQSVVCAALAGALLCACGGTPGTPNGPVVNSPGGDGPPPTKLVPVKLTVTLPPPQRGIDPNYLSPNTQSLTIGLVSVNGSPVTGVHASTLDTIAGSQGCSAGHGVTCVTTISGAPGADVFAVSTYAGRRATGALLSIGTAAARVGSGGGRIPIDSKLSLTINGVIASLQLGVSPNWARRGKPASSAVSLVAFDASGAQIIGAGDYQSPIALAIQGDAAKAFTLQAPRASGESVVIAKPTSGIALRYDGSAQASSVNVSATVNGPSGMNVSAPFTLKGKQPPPPVGTIYALNLGSHNGQGATVTEYAGSAKGNAPPKRTLQLDPKLYARSIAVDAKGELYVGYFNSANGVPPSGNGQPDPKNIVAIYAPGASGNQKPAATLIADPKTQTSLFPVSLVFNAAGGLVTYGATAVDGNNGGNAVLTYAAGSTGPAAPQHGFDFGLPSPYLRSYPGPTGLVLDQQGNVYIGGTLQTLLQTAPGVYVASASDIGNPNASPARTIPWDQTTEVLIGHNIALDPGGEIYVANEIVEGSGTICQGRTNAFAAGASGGVTDKPPLRVLTFQSVVVKVPGCANSQDLGPFFPSIAVYGTILFAADDFNNTITTYSTSSSGTVKPTITIAGSATQLNAPIAIAISSLSSRSKARLVTGARGAPDPPIATLTPSSPQAR